MLQNLKHLYGNRVSALDGTIGYVKDFYFERSTWTIRYIAVETGLWLAGRTVLFTPRALGRWDHYEKNLHLELSKKQIEAGPMLGTDESVSREHEIACHRHYGWPEYWTERSARSVGNEPVLSSHSPGHPEVHSSLAAAAHLESTHAFSEYQIQTDTGSLGTFNGFTAFVPTWIISDLIVEPVAWYAGIDLRVSTDQIRQIDHEDCSVLIALAKSDAQWIAGKHLTRAWAGTSNF